ncbi:MAG TPA: sugar ABC transporter permease [Spirochaetales bacterium]|mgnify:CR=1 FL=1|nr:sugar ABC transporter permease [Spirochaetales bacterium]HPS15337.1 sugar ABC transporter permease [Spirochaetales bacterium]
MQKKERFQQFLLTLPSTLIFILVVVYPFIAGLYYSLTDWDGIAKTWSFVGLGNYIKLFQSKALLTPLKNTLQFTLVNVVACNILAIFVATGIQRSTRLNNALRVIFFMPFIISLVVSSYMWTYLYSAVIYPVFGIRNPLGNPQTANLGLSMISIWRNMGYCVVIYVAALQTIPESLYEAAAVEGANAWTKFTKITLPMLIPALNINLTLILGWGLKEFDTVMAATGGGPGDATTSVAFYVYKTTFVWGKAGFGQAIAFVMMLGIVLLTSLVSRFLRSREVEM